MANRIRQKSLWNLVPGLGLVTILGIIAAAFMPLSRINYIGASTARIKSVYTVFGIPVSESYTDTPLTIAFEKHLGSLPVESKWIYMNERGCGVFGIKASGWGEDIFSNADMLADLIDPAHLQLPAPDDFWMTEEAKRLALTNYRQCVIESKHHDSLPEDYVECLWLAVPYLDRPAQPQDIPSIEEVKDQMLWNSKWQTKLDSIRETWIANHPEH